MIRYADQPAVITDLKTVLAGEDLLHGCILATRYRARGVCADSRFWVCYDASSCPRAAILGQPDCFILCDGGLHETDELAEFLRFFGCRCLVGRRGLLDRLYGPVGMSAPIGDAAMTWTAGDGQADRQVVRVREGFRGIYDLIVSNYDNFDNYGAGGSYDDWLSGLRLRERDGLSGVFALYEDGLPVATAAIAGSSARCADIGSVVTRKNRRGRGLARRLVLHLVSVAAGEGRIPVLGCAHNTPGLQPFYERIGFHRYDDWAVCNASGDKTET